MRIMILKVISEKKTIQIYGLIFKCIMSDLRCQWRNKWIQLSEFEERIERV